MTKFIYDENGFAVGFELGPYIFDMNGNPIGQIVGTHIFKMSGEYVGEYYKKMVVDMNMNPGNVSAQIYSGNVGSSGNPGKRGPVICEYPDVFYKLLK